MCFSFLSRLQVAESGAVVACIRDRFDALRNEVGFSAPFGSNWNCLLPEVPYEDLEAVHSIKPKNYKLSSANQDIQVFTVHDALQALGEDFPLIHESESKKEINVFSESSNEVSTLKGRSINKSQSEMIENNLSRFSCLEEESHVISQYTNYNLEVLESSEGIMNSYFAGDLIESLLGDKDANDMGHGSTSSLLSFPMDCELHKALGVVVMQRQISDCIQGSSEDASRNARPVRNSEIINVIEPLIHESNGHIAKGGDSVNLFEDAVTKMHNGSDDSSSRRFNDVNSSTVLSGQFSASYHAGNQSEGSALVQDDSIMWSHVKPEFITSGGNAFTSSSVSSSSFKSTLTTLVDEEQKKGYDYLQPRKGSKASNVNKKGARAGSNQKPRPRDRQMIQDRVKELRELVPNGAKACACSA